MYDAQNIPEILREVIFRAVITAAKMFCHAEGRGA